MMEFVTAAARAWKTRLIARFCIARSISDIHRHEANNNKTAK
jgi:hypothetical protein